MRTHLRANTLHLRETRRGSFYIPFVALFLILFLIVSYIQIKTYFDPTSTDAASKRITRDLGGKQGEILRSVREGERIRLYVDEAARIAKAETASKYVCGQPYLNYYKISVDEQGTCDQTPASFANNIFSTVLAEYPKGSIATMFGEPTVTQQGTGSILRYEGVYRIPIAGGEIAGQTAAGGSAGASGTFAGALENWPTTDPRITSIFGKRDLGSQSGSRNHAGIDIGTHKKAGEPIRALIGGVASYYPDGDSSFVAIDSGGVVFEYIHVSPGGVVGARRGVQVQPGDIIAVSSAYASGEHLHLQVFVKDIQRNTVESIPAWRNHIGTADRSPSGLTYAVVKTTTNKAYLDPLCFFDRAFIDQKVRSSGIDWYARRAPNSLYETCDVYERDLGLSRRFSSIGSGSTTVATQVPTSPIPSTTVPSATTPSATPAPGDTSATPAEAASTSPRDSTNERVRRTFENLDRQGLIDLGRTAAEAEGFDPAILFALITQESEGVSDAVSPTGCIGVGQFCYSTAQNYKDLFTKLTRCECTGAACRDPNQRKCTPQNDDRFNAQNSVRASARLIGGHLRTYAQYDHKEAMALVAYNAGPGVVQQVVAKTGPNPSWSQMRAILQTDTSINYGAGIDPSAKRIEVVAYVDRITQTYLPEWGGSFISGGSYTSDIPGFYTLKLALDIDLTQTAAAVISRIEESLETCESTACIRDRVITTAEAEGARAQREALNSETGCMSGPERAQAYLAQQFLWCKRSPDNACGCELFESVEAKYTVSATETRITEHKDIAVNPSAFPSMPGLAFERGGDGTSTDAVTIIDALSSGAKVLRSLASVELSLSERRDDTRVDLAFAPDVRIDALWKSDVYGGLALARGALTPANTCVLPNSLKVEAYCLTSNNNQFEPTVFYVDMRAKSEPEYLAKQYDMKSSGGLTGTIGSFFGGGGDNVRFFTDEKFPYAQLIVTEMVGNVPRENISYYRIVEGPRGAYEELRTGFTGFIAGLGSESIAGPRVIERFQGEVIVTAPSTEFKHLHQLKLPDIQGMTNKQLVIVLLDDNLREGARFTVDRSLTSELSGIIIAPRPEDVLTGGVPVPGVG